MVSTREPTRAPAVAFEPTLSIALNAPRSHTPVLSDAIVAALDPRDGGFYIDGTVGGGGHSTAILDRCLPNGHLLGIDVDNEALRRAEANLSQFSGSYTLAHGSYADMNAIRQRLGFGLADGILLDLGISSLQLQDNDRGFSFRSDGPLDMRFDTAQAGPTAAEIVNHSSAPELVEILKAYGEEPRARAVAAAIVANRPFNSAAQLAAAIAPVAMRPRGGYHPATRTFQALRVATNNELDNIKKGLNQAIEALAPGGTLAVISYHSLEDRLVKEAFRRESRDCVCAAELPQCVCDHKATLKILNRKIITATDKEKIANPRSRSARLRTAARICSGAKGNSII